jgi:enterochelin esterase-like enzyme
MGRMEALSVISVGFLALLFATAALLWLALWPAWRRFGRAAVVGVLSGALLVSVAASADAVNAHYQYLPRVSDVLGQRDWPTVSAKRLDTATTYLTHSVPGDVTPPTLAALIGPRPRGAVVTLDVADEGVGFPGKTALVYLPPQYFTDTTERFPVVYLLHGSPGMPVDWLRGGDAANAGLEAATQGRPQILVMPHLSRNWLDDSECVDGAHMKVETYLISDLLPAVDAQLRTVADRAGRTIGGMSAGGYCALNLGLRHRELFGSIIDMSGYTHPTHTGGMTALFGARADLANVTAANSPDVYGIGLPANPATRLYFLCGRSDHEPLTEMSAMRAVLQRRGLPVTWVVVPGGHTYGVWRPGLISALAWSEPEAQLPLAPATQSPRAA